MLPLLATSADVPVKDVDVPASLYWYMGAIVLVCLIVFFVIPLVLSSKRTRDTNETNANDHDA